ncbi:MAG: NosD domain-containing protein, partial [Euryarchaeota archaeon]
VLIAPGTYTENVVVNKPLTISAAGSRPTVRSADASKDVFRLTSPGVRIDGLMIIGGASGVNIQNTSKCVVTNIVARDNVMAVYLSYSMNNEISNSNLAGNGYGVYSDYSSNNTISSNVATGEKGTSSVLGDGIYLFYSDSNKVSNNNLSANHNYGISLYHSSNNAISGNNVSKNEDYGVRLRESDNNVLSFNTMRANAKLGILIIQTTNNQIYLNNFIDQPTAISGATEVKLNSPEAMAYTYNGVARTGFMSNYYSDYKGTDANGTGIGSAPSAYGDKYPLIQSVASYGNIVLASAVTPTPPPTSTFTSTSTSGNQSASGTKLPGFEVATAVAGLTIAGLLLLGRKYRAK